MRVFEYRTVRGSTYQVSKVGDGWFVRLVNQGGDEAAPRVIRNGAGAWAELALEPHKVAGGLMFVWPASVGLSDGTIPPGDPPGAGQDHIPWPRTLTSPVITERAFDVDTAD